MKKQFLGVFLCMSLISSLSFAHHDSSVVDEPPQNTLVKKSKVINRSSSESQPSSLPQLQVFNDQYQATIKAQTEKNEIEKANAILFKKEKVGINKVLANIVKIIESERAGTAKARVAAVYLRAVMEIHNHPTLGTREKLDAYFELNNEVRYALKKIRSEVKIEYTRQDMEDEIFKLVDEKFDTKITSLLNDYYVEEQGNMSLRGFKVGVAVGVGFELGLGGGKFVTTTGKKYLAAGLAASGALGLGPLLSVSQYKGQTKIKTQDNYFLTKKMISPLDTFVAGVSESMQTMPGNSIEVKEVVIALVRANAIGVMKSIKLNRLPGRDFKYMRSRLGLVR